MTDHRRSNRPEDRQRETSSGDRNPEEIRCAGQRNPAERDEQTRDNRDLHEGVQSDRDEMIGREGSNRDPDRGSESRQRSDRDRGMTGSGRTEQQADGSNRALESTDQPDSEGGYGRGSGFDRQESQSRGSRRGQLDDSRSREADRDLEDMDERPDLI